MISFSIFVAAVVTAMYVFIRKSQQHAKIKGLSFFVVADPGQNRVDPWGL